MAITLGGILHKFIIIEIIFIIIKLAMVVWLLFAHVNWVTLLLVAIGGGVLLRILYALIRRYYS